MMRENHWSADELVEHLYGIREGDSHLRECPVCAGWLAEMETKRRQSAAWPEPSAAFLAAQRQQVFARAERQAFSHAARLAPALGALATIILGVFLLFPRPNRQPPSGRISDAQLFAEINALIESPEPRAVAPIRNLFQE